MPAEVSLSSDLPSEKKPRNIVRYFSVSGMTPRRALTCLALIACGISASVKFLKLVFAASNPYSFFNGKTVKRNKKHADIEIQLPR